MRVPRQRAVQAPVPFRLRRGAPGAAGMDCRAGDAARDGSVGLHPDYIDWLFYRLCMPIYVVRAEIYRPALCLHVSGMKRIESGRQCAVVIARLCTCGMVVALLWCMYVCETVNVIVCLCVRCVCMCVGGGVDECANKSPGGSQELERPLYERRRVET